MDEPRVNEKFFPTDRFFLEHADLYQFLLVHRCGLPTDNSLIGQVVNPAMRLLEDKVHELVAVNLRRHLANMLHRVPLQFPNRRDLGHGPMSGFFDALKHESHPIFPGIALGHCPKQTVVIRPVLDEVAAQIQDRQGQQALADQELTVQNSPGTTVAIRKWMNRFELIVGHR